jgi:hypothetical protein
LPKSLGNLTALEDFRLTTTAVTGEIPEEIGELAALKTFLASGNKLIGPIPASFSRLDNLVRIDVFNNELSGKIPLLSSTLSICNLAPINNFTCHRADNTACLGKGVLGIPFY